MEFKEKADQEQALDRLRENSNPDARPGGKRHKKCLSGNLKKKKKRKIKKKEKKTTLKPQKSQLKKEMSGATTQKRWGNRLDNTGCLPQ